MDLLNIPTQVLSAVRQREIYTDEEIAQLSPRELFNEYCMWEGLIGHGHSLWDTVMKLNEIPKPAVKGKRSALPLTDASLGLYRTLEWQ